MSKPSKKQKKEKHNFLVEIQTGASDIHLARVSTFNAHEAGMVACSNMKTDKEIVTQVTVARVVAVFRPKENKNV